MNIEGGVQNYAWGVCGSRSLVASVHKSNLAALGREFNVDETKPYAELWFGNHPSGPSQAIDPITGTVTPIGEWLASQKTEMPFLFKVLSIHQPLSLQLHPDEAHARAMHQDDPDHYRDPYDKPEMAVSMSEPFEAFCGFRHRDEILSLAAEFPPFGRLLPNEGDVLKEMMRSLHSMSQGTVDAMIDEMLAVDEIALQERPIASEWRISARPPDVDIRQAKEIRDVAFQLFKRLHQEFPYDRGVFAAFFLNYLRLRPGEALFLAPNTIHAYIRGNCLEVMRCSDNVIRAGLTPKFQDVTRLLELVEYKSVNASSCQVAPKDIATTFLNGDSNCHLKLYSPECPFFRIYILHLSAKATAADLRIPEWSPLVVLGVSGTTELVHRKRHDQSEVRQIVAPGISLILAGWQSMTVTNVGTSSCDLVTDSSAVFPADGGSTLVFVMPNVPPADNATAESRMSEETTFEG